jgi:hypothetical protein
MLTEQQKTISALRRELREARGQRESAKRDAAVAKQEPIEVRKESAVVPTSAAVPVGMGEPRAPQAHSQPAYAPGWSVSAAWLGLTPSAGDTGYVLASPISTTSPNGTRINNDFDMDGAYRLGLAYQFQSGRKLEAAYTNFGEKNAGSVNGNNLWATRGSADMLSAFENYAGTASSALDLSYSRFDLLMSEPVHAWGARLSFLYGLEYAKIDLKERHRYSSAAATGASTNSSELRGIGPQVGLGLDYDLLRHGAGVLGFNVTSTASLLFGTAEVSQTGTLNGTTLVNVSDEKSDYLVPAFHLRAGLTYGFTMAHLQGSLGLGYAFSTYLGAVNRGTYADDVADGLSVTKRESFDVRGPYGDFKLKF